MAGINEDRTGLTVFVNVYEVGQAFGGHEEGGWYYRYGTLQRQVVTKCLCPWEDVLHQEIDGEDKQQGSSISRWMETDCSRFWISSYQYDHKPDCRAMAVVAEENQKIKNPEPQFAESFTTAGGTWDMDSSEDAPDEYAREIVTEGGWEIRLELQEGRDFPLHRPHYE